MMRIAQIAAALIPMFMPHAARAADQSAEPSSDPRAVVTAGTARFTVLTPACIRMEWSASRAFEDRASLVFLNRRLPVPKFEATTANGRLTIRTERCTLRFRDDGRTFHAGNLSIEFPLGGKTHSWRPGMPDAGNLGGTTRTLDGVSGACAIEPGLLSRDGWVLVDDSRTPLLAKSDDGALWAAPRPGAANSAAAGDAAPDSAHAPHDWYFMCYGHDYQQALTDYTKLAGRIPLPPRYAFGAWWSRYWAYSDAELRQLVQEFREHDVPLDVLVVDMDWHLDGWTGYTWNPKYFPDPAGYLKWVHDQGLRTTLNLHPADGVGKHEAAFADVARAMGKDPAQTDVIPFDCTDRRFVDAYFKYLHHPLEKMGVDFWWMDWQQGSETKIPGLDPLRWLNYLHWADLEKRAAETGRRPLIFSRWGGLENHRYQIGFSGDTYCNWESLAFQPFFTATAGNVGYTFWSHDIGGHQPGVVDPELYVRWIQFGALSPVLRTHTTKNPLAERRIWAFPKEYFEAARAAYQLRYQLIPYIYTAARACYDSARPLCRPLYYEWPEIDESYEWKNEYLFGDDLLVAPVTEPMNRQLGASAARVWIPPGEWINWFNGRRFTGPSEILLRVALDEIPLFVRAGAIIPTAPKMQSTSEKAVDPLVLNVFAGGETRRVRLYEDDGLSADYLDYKCAWTELEQQYTGDAQVVVIEPVQGGYSNMPGTRDVEIRLRNISRPEEVQLDGETIGADASTERPSWRYDAASLSAVVQIPKRPAAVKSTIRVKYTPISRKQGWIFDSQNISPFSKSCFGLLREFTALDRAAALLGEHGPADIRQAASLRSELTLAPDRSPQVYSGFQKSWPDLLRSVAHSAAPADLKQRAIAELLGLAVRVDVSPCRSADKGFSVQGSFQSSIDALTVIADNTLWVGFGPGDRVRVPYSSTTAKEASERIEVFRELKVDRTLLLSAAPRTQVLSATFECFTDNGDFRFELPIEQVILPSIPCWHVIGPFPGEYHANFAKALPPEQKADPTIAVDNGNGGKLEWKKVVREIHDGDDLTKEFYVDLRRELGGEFPGSVAYGLTYLHAPKETDAVLLIGSDDGVAAWLNGREIHRNPTMRGYLNKQDRVAVHLNAGVNPLLLKIPQATAGWGFSVHVETADGRAMPEIEARLTPN